MRALSGSNGVLRFDVAIGDEAGAVVGRARAIAYSWNQATLTLSKDAGDGAGSQPAVTGVQAFQLRYFDANDAEILPANLAANLPNIRRVMIDLTARSATALNQGTFRGTSSVRPTMSRFSASSSAASAASDSISSDSS